MSIQKAEMSVERIENGQIVEHVAYPYVEYEHVTMENGMDIMSMIRDDVSTPTVTHDATSWRVGQGDGDVSKSIVDSSVAIMTIKGQTYQNILPSPSLRNSMTNGKTMQKLNEGYDSVSTVDGVCKSAILTGNTLVNLMVDYQEEKLVRYGNPPETPNVANMTMLKPNTEYTLFYKAKYQNDGDVGKLLFRFAIDGSTIRDMSVAGTNPYTTTYQQYVHKFTTPSTIDYFIFRSNGNYFFVKECVLLEGDYANVDIPYFTGMQSVRMPVLKTTGKNLFDGFFEKGAYAATSLDKTNDSSGTRYIINEPFTVEKIQYAISIADDYQIFVRCFKNRVLIKDGAWVNQVTFDNTNGNYDKITIVIRKMDNSIIDENILFKLQIEQGKVVTPYEPYKSNILTVNEPIELRGIGQGSNRVEDELDCLTGEVVENTIKLTFSGIENWETSTNLTNYMTFRLAKPSNMITADSHSNANKYVCDKLQIVSSNTVGSTEIEAIWFSTGHMYIRLPKTKASSLEEFKTYLSTNNIQVVSCAKQPVVKTVDLTILDQDNQPTTQLNSFANGYIQVSSQGLIPSVDYEVPTSNSYHVDLMKPNTQYTMKNMQGTFTIDNIQYNASTNGTFTSPSALTNNFMITSVAQRQPMLLEGDVTDKTIPYFKGIKSAFEDEDKIEVLSTGKNLFDINYFYKEFSKLTGRQVKLAKDSIIMEGVNSTRHDRVIGNIKLKPNTTYKMSCNIKTIGDSPFATYEVYYNDALNRSVYLTQNTQNGEFRRFTTESSGIIQVRLDCPRSNNVTEYSNIYIVEDNESYEPYKSNSTKIPLLSPLRSLPNGVRDEIVLDRVNHKAKIIQRVGEDLTQLDTPLITEVNLEGYPYVYKGGHIFLNTEIAPITEVTYSINQAHQIESSNEDILRHQNEINHLYELIAQYVQVQYEAELIDIVLQG